MICVDESGTLNLQPRPRRGWFLIGLASRLRATFNRTGGVRHMFAILDLASGQMFYRFPGPQTVAGVRRLPRQLLARFPASALYVICDSLALEDLGHQLVPGQQRRAGFHPKQRLLAELDRARINRTAPLRPRRQRLP